MLIRYPNTRGYLKNDWIESRRTFSNNSYWNPKYMNYGPIQVINDDILQPGQIVPKHEHKNMEILGYLVDGELEHWDSEGNLNTTSYGQIQHMSCGSSIWHTEKCTSEIPARYLQIWIEPLIKESIPNYEIIEKSNIFGDIFVNNQSTNIKCGWITGEYVLDIKKNAYLYVVSGNIILSDTTLSEGYGLEMEVESLVGTFNAHIILIEF